MCVCQCNSETIKAVIPQKLLDPLKDLVTLISKGIDGQRDPTAKQFNTILLLQLPAIFLTPPCFENDANKSKANEAIKQQINTFIQSKQLPSIQERCVDPTSHIQKSKRLFSNYMEKATRHLTTGMSSSSRKRYKMEI